MEEAKEVAKTTNQDNQDPRKSGNWNPNPTGKGGFADHPELISPGGWDKTKVFSYQYRRFMNMSGEEIEQYSKIPKSKRSVVEDLAYGVVVRARRSLSDIKEITDRTEGKPTQALDLSGGLEIKQGLTKEQEDKIDEFDRLESERIARRYGDKV